MHWITPRYYCASLTCLISLVSLKCVFICETSNNVSSPLLDSEVGDEEIHHAEAKADPGQGGGPGLQPPGHSLRTSVAVPVT